MLNRKGRKERKGKARERKKLISVIDKRCFSTSGSAK
jgi:hypothetical protein